MVLCRWKFLRRRAVLFDRALLWAHAAMLVRRSCVFLLSVVMPA